MPESFQHLIKKTRVKLRVNYFWSTFGCFMQLGLTSYLKDIKIKQIGKPGQNYQGEH